MKPKVQTIPRLNICETLWTEAMSRGRLQNSTHTCRMPTTDEEKAVVAAGMRDTTLSRGMASLFFTGLLRT